jgi:hypothetical protein
MLQIILKLDGLNSGGILVKHFSKFSADFKQFYKKKANKGTTISQEKMPKKNNINYGDTI